MLYLVRHGETAANVEGVFLGRADPPLTDLGRRQAAALAVALPTPKRLVTSPLRRARETAAAFGVPAEIDDRWIELDYGELEGTHPSAVPDDVRARWRSDPSYAPPGGESLASLAARVRPACEALVAAADLDDVVVVTHVSPVKSAIAWALDVDDTVAWRMWVEDAAVARVGVGPDGPVLRSFNEHWP
ncbi:MAG: histidine phosphatase family protein [Acidimicrobiales bacterium]